MAGQNVKRVGSFLFLLNFKEKGQIAFAIRPIHHHPSFGVITPQIFLNSAY
ncbi:hypothetical protein MATR_16570 [Marivirga tractuosa]|nr:hypothetical protein MATR_16570 [Marivirga tractuosa]